MAISKFLVLFASLVLILSPEAMAQKKKKKLDRQLVGDELAFGRQAAAFGLWNEAIFRWEKVIKKDPNNPDALNNLAIAYESVGNYDKAKALYQQALSLDEDSQAIRKNLKRFNSFYRKHRRQLERQAAAKERRKNPPAEASVAAKAAPTDAAAVKAGATQPPTVKAAAQPVAREGGPIKVRPRSDKGSAIKARPKKNEKKDDTKNNGNNGN